MQKKIKSIKELPDWFKSRVYKKGLSKVDWFREIRMRQSLTRLIERAVRNPSLSQEMITPIVGSLLNMLENRPHPDSAIFLVSQSDQPVHDLTAGEVLYLRSAIRDDDLGLLEKKLDGVLSLWIQMVEEKSEAPPQFGEYDRKVAMFFKELDKNPHADKLDRPIQKFLEGIGNPWLSYGRPINGYPITVDTQYDDETIIKFFKNWLAEKRKLEGERVRRPFLQQDFDNWEYFKIREIFDLETWATIKNLKIQDNVIAQALWPNSSDNFSPIEVLRTTARKKVKEIFTYHVVVRLYGQLLFEYGENFLEQ